MPMWLEFAKMHGLGNDFMVIDLVTQQCEIDGDRVSAWGDRRTGVGFDQLLLVEPPTDPEADFRYRIFNTDGSEAEQCGNGARCVARYVADRRLSPKPELVLQTLAGHIVTRRVNGDAVEVDMGEPRFAAADVPFEACAEAVRTLTGETATYELTLEDGVCRFTTVSMGNPHAVVFVDSVADAPVDVLGPALVGHPAFSQGVNVGFCEIVDPGFVRLRVFERGAGETRACGSGACAAVAAGRLLEKLGARVKVSLPGGKVRINWQGPGSTIKLAGPATLVFEGRISI